MKATHYILCLLFLYPMLTIAQPEQTPAYIEGQVMVMLKPGAPEAQASGLTSLSRDFSGINLSEIQVLSRRMGIVLMGYTPGLAADARILEDLCRHPAVKLAQFNHRIEARVTFPDDPSFSLQWNMHNEGQSGGLADADIDGPEAWDLTTGGPVTSTGDTIVIAIVDDGFDLAHEDIKFWKNHGEIPANAIDDDGNGYVDDYDGWNSLANNGFVISRDHGTHVTGIAAARGNNGLGVTGVNWNTLVMPVVGSSTVEASVVAGYAYVLEMRARYNESDGAEGAFVVSTNASFGVNYGQPEDFPIWGAMYDSLGAYGIISAGATANLNIDVDIEGDIPTAFPSEYLVSVTNTTSNDVKSSTAAYGLNTIDLGAPGTGVYSTRWNNGYGTKTGTSMASPHVAGAAAFLYSAADTSFMQACHADPGAMALVVRQHVLNGVDSISSLQGICVTGGRLNLFNAANRMVNPEIMVNPMAVHLQLNSDSLYNAGFTVTNTGESAYQLHATSNDSDSWILLSHEEEILEPEAASIIGFQLNTSGLMVGRYISHIYIQYAGSENYWLPVVLDIDSSSVEAYLSVEPGLAEVSQDQGVVEVMITSNINWIVEDTCNWVFPSSNSGFFSDTLYLDYTANSSMNSRECSVFISGAGLSDTVRIIQDASPAFLELSADTVFLQPAGGSYGYFDIFSNTVWYVVEQDDWLVMTPDSGSGSQPVLARSLVANATPSARIAEVIVLDTTGTLIRNLIVHQATSNPQGLEDHALNGKFSIRPNPSDNELVIDLSSIRECEIIASIFEISTGKIVLKEQMNPADQAILDIRGLAPGAYLLKINACDQAGTTRFIVQ